MAEGGGGKPISFTEEWQSKPFMHTETTCRNPKITWQTRLPDEIDQVTGSAVFLFTQQHRCGTLLSLQARQALLLESKGLALKHRYPEEVWNNMSLMNPSDVKPHTTKVACFLLPVLIKTVAL